MYRSENGRASISIGLAGVNEGMNKKKKNSIHLWEMAFRCVLIVEGNEISLAECEGVGIFLDGT